MGVRILPLLPINEDVMGLNKEERKLLRDKKLRETRKKRRLENFEIKTILKEYKKEIKKKKRKNNMNVKYI